MLKQEQNFIPIATSAAGLSLTPQNWRDAKITSLSYSLANLLHKPGHELLTTSEDLGHYLGWSGQLILNAASLISNKEGIYTLKSPYDGSKITFTPPQLVKLIHHLKPYAVVLPPKILQDYPTIWDNWLESITPFIPATDLQQARPPLIHGVYLSEFSASKVNQLTQWEYLPRYVSGTLNVPLINQLRAHKVFFIETDSPAQNAFLGKVYTNQGDIDLTHPHCAMQFEPIDKECSCPSCSQHLSKAYFHHLLQHTPLLCQRFLIMHNAFWLAPRR